MTIDISKKEFEAIAFAHAKLQIEHTFNFNRMQPKPKAHLLEAIKQLGDLIDRIEKKMEEDEAIPRTTE